MYAKELIGRKAIRTAPAMYMNGVIDNGFTNVPIWIRSATDSHIVFSYLDESGFDQEKIHVISADFCDDNWVDYDQLIAGAEFSVDDEETHEKVYIVTRIDSKLDLSGIFVGVYKTLESAEKFVLDLYPDSKERGYHYWFTYDECGNVETCMMIHEEELL